MTNKYEQAADWFQDLFAPARDLAITLLRAAAKLKPGVDAAKILEQYAAGELVARQRPVVALSLFEEATTENARLRALVTELEQALHMQVCTDSTACGVDHD